MKKATVAFLVIFAIEKWFVLNAFFSLSAIISQFTYALGNADPLAEIYYTHPYLPNTRIFHIDFFQLMIRDHNMLLFLIFIIDCFFTFLLVFTIVYSEE